MSEEAAVPSVPDVPATPRDSGHWADKVVRLSVGGERVTGEERLLQDLQPQRERIRDVRQGPDGALYLLTDNARGRVLKLVPTT